MIGKPNQPNNALDMAIGEFKRWASLLLATGIEKQGQALTLTLNYDQKIIGNLGRLLPPLITNLSGAI